MSPTSPRVAVLYNAPSLPLGHPHRSSESDVVEVAGSVFNYLIRAGFEAWLQPASPPVLGLVSELSSTGPDLVFNLIEGFAGSSSGEPYVTGLLELLGLPYTGCPPEAQALCRLKGLTKTLLRGAGLPTAPSALATAGPPFAPPFDGPYFVKPDAEDGSLGIDQDSVLMDASGLDARVARIRREHGPGVLIEAYLPGREFNVGLLALPEPMALPAAEVNHAAGPGRWPILTYDAKWDVGSASDQASPVVCPAPIASELADRLRDLAVLAFRATRCRDYARVDFRLDGSGRPMILEVNPNPDIGPDAGWARALSASGRDYGPTLVALANQALARGVRRG